MTRARRSCPRTCSGWWTPPRAGRWRSTCWAAPTVALSFSGQAIAADMLKELGKGEGQVSIIAWPGYIERGETDKAYDWVTEFEKATGC